MPKHLEFVSNDPALLANESRLRLQTIVRLRWFAILGQLFTVSTVYFGLRFDLPIGFCLLTIAASAWLNIFLGVNYTLRHRLSARFASFLLAYDIMQLAILLFLTGGIKNPFTLLIIAPITVSAATLPGRNTIILGATALALTSFLFFFHLPLPWSEGENPLFSNVYLFGFLVAIIACKTFLAVYAWRLSHEARKMSAALTATELVLAREQQLHALDGLAAAAAHELGTPLGTIVLVAKELGKTLPGDSSLSEDLDLMRSQAERCRDILKKLTHQPSGQDPMHLHVTLSQIINEAAGPHRNNEIRITYQLAPNEYAVNRSEPHGERNPGLIYGLGNLIENAVSFAHNEVIIRANWGGGKVVIEIIDDGHGFSPDVIDHIGEPYVTTRSSNRGNSTQTGLGLGLFIAKTLLERTGAVLEFDNRSLPHHGAVIKMTWPRGLFEAKPVLNAISSASESKDC
ncbi:MAG TPA: Sensor histidine kinase RegB [Hyphomicrobiaceae bacterium MAG_BT-2024]